MQKKFLTAMAALLSVALFFMGCPADNGEEEEPNLSGSIVISATSGGTAATSATTGATLYAVYSGGTETVAYQWNKDGAVISSGGTGASYMPATAGSYTVTVSASGYQSKTSAPVTVTGGGGTLAEAKGKLTLTGFNEFNGKYVYPVLITSSGKTLTGINGADYSAGNPIISMVPISSGTAEVPLYTMNPAETSVSNAFVPYEG
jgi:hypothetical protein